MTVKSGIRDANATRERLITAAAAEFAQYGIAGARVDRIAAEANSNKAQIYHYYGNKDGLFDAVFDSLVAQVVTEVPMDATDLPGYAGLLFDGYDKYPEIARLATWYRLERGAEAPPIPAIVEANNNKVNAIAEAQRAGAIRTSYEPEVILGLVMHAAALWTSQTPEYDRLTRTMTRSQRRRIVMSIVHDITAPAD